MLSVALVACAMAATGCEQIKSLSKVHELEGKVDALTTQMAALSEGKPDKKPDEKKAEAKKADEKKVDEKKADEKKADEKKADEKKIDEKKPDDKKPEDSVAKADDKPVEKADKKPDDKKPDDKKPDEPEAKTDAKPDADPQAKPASKKPAGDPALARLLAVVAENTKAKPTGPGNRWSYDGKTGPAAWSSIDPAWAACNAGKSQSPVDIEPRAGTASPIEFTYKPTPAAVIDTGHSLQLNVQPGSEIEIGDTVYQLVQVHFHTPSEHTIAGEHYPLEVQLVHQDGTGKLAILSVLYDSGAESKPLGQLWSAWPHKVGVATKLGKPFDPSELLPETRTVFRYTGSLTTPPCTEGVVWSVMRRTLSDSKAHLAAFASHYPHNAREVQPLGDRKIE
ncbi:MAG TPA: carbonic anhydrase family protein [Kofleriaceae bacterium]|nr:carbonic anhydrase family protein [Kofleriaceae bacterium]